MVNETRTYMEGRHLALSKGAMQEGATERERDRDRRQLTRHNHTDTPMQCEIVLKWQFGTMGVSAKRLIVYMRACKQYMCVCVCACGKGGA